MKNAENRYSILGFEPVTFTAHTPAELDLVAHPQRPFHGRYLLIDPPAGFLVVQVTVGHDEQKVSGTAVPAEVFGCAGVAQLERTKDGAIVVIDPERPLPSRIEFTRAMPGVAIRVRLRVAVPVRGMEARTVYAAMAGTYED